MGIIQQEHLIINLGKAEKAALIKNKYHFHGSVRVSPVSKFEDMKWLLYDPNNAAIFVTRKELYEIKWDQVPLPSQLIWELKIFCFMRIALRGKIAGTANLIKSSFNLFHTLIIDSLLSGKDIKSILHITLRDLRGAIIAYTYAQSTLFTHVRLLIIELFTNPQFIQQLDIPFSPWNRKDIENLPWQKGGEGRGKNKKTYFPSGLFVERSNRARAVIHDYLKTIGQEPEDNNDDNPYYNLLNDSKMLIADLNPDFRENHDSYLDAYVEFLANRIGIRNIKACSQRYKFTMDRRQLRKIINKTRNASYSIITQYTGMRTSALRSLKTGCIKILHGCPHLFGTEVKGNEKDDLPAKDDWVAIDSVRDAVRVLELQRPFTGNNPFLFGAFGVCKKPIPKRQAVGVSEFLLDLLEDTRWRQWIKQNGQITPYSDRHTLVRELANLRVGLPAITRQLHHVSNLLRNARISNTSFVYGGIGESQYSITMRDKFTELDAQINAEAEKSQIVRLKAVFGEEAHLAGPDAERIKEEIEMRFAGIGLSGIKRDQYIEAMAANGFTLPACGFGLCGDTLLPEDSADPCKGDLSCDDDCPNKVYDATQKDTVRHLYRNAIKQQLNKVQYHNKKIFAHHEKVWANVLRQWGEDPDQLKEQYISKLASKYGPDKLKENIP